MAETITGNSILSELIYQSRLDPSERQVMLVRTNNVMLEKTINEHPEFINDLDGFSFGESPEVVYPGILDALEPEIDSEGKVVAKFSLKEGQQVIIPFSANINKGPRQIKELTYV